MKKVRDRFSEIHADYYPLVLNVVYSKVGNTADAEDICQEVFIRLFEKLDGVENIRKWLLGAVRMVTLEFYRKRKPDVTIDDVFDDVKLTFVNGFRDTRIIIAGVLEEEGIIKEDEDRMLFELIAVYNYSYSEAGRELGFSKRTAEYRYRRLVDRMMDALEKRGIKNIEELL